jgi:hypothetical protein
VAAGSTVTVVEVLLVHPFPSGGKVYVIIDVPEFVEDAVTNPVLSTVATSVLLLVHEPPGVALLKLVVVPVHKLVVPVICVMVGSGFTVIVLVTLLVQLFALGAVM